MSRLMSSSGGGRVRDRADGDAFDAGGGDRADGFQRHAARRFQLDLALAAGAVAQLDGRLHVRAVHVVEQDDVDAVDLQHLAELLEVVDLDLDQPARVFRAALARRRRPRNVAQVLRAGRRRGGCP